MRLVYYPKSSKPATIRQRMHEDTRKKGHYLPVESRFFFNVKRPIFIGVKDAFATNEILSLPSGALKERIHASMLNPLKAIILILAMLFASLALAEDFKTVSGKIYKDATISHVEADGIVLRTKTGISKVYFVELPKDVQERFHYGAAAPTGKTVTQRIEKAESADPPAQSVDAGSFADKFAEKVSKKLDERDSILQGKHTRPRRVGSDT
jgi:hypothetical protein